ncbi:hypothetical protein M0805_007469 [Coniferiporia weirii]|nr:hypothetical protein M0805_007469 [Coniferiporia weirii]
MTSRLLVNRAQLQYTCFAFTRHLRTQTRFEYDLRDAVDNTAAFPRPAGLATPRQLTQFLDEYVVGQENAKKVLSVAVFNHYNRVRSNLSQLKESEVAGTWDEETPDGSVSPAQIHPHPYRMSATHTIPLQARDAPPLFEKSNVLVIGPTGSGKTLLAKTLARVLDVPFSVSDATSFTQAGYVGEDVDMCIQRLLISSGWDERRASSGIVYIDEVDKIARKSGGMEGQRDVGGEGVQQALLRMMEGTKITIHAKPSGTGSDLGPAGSDGRSRAGQRPPVSEPRSDTYSIDTTNILFILSGAFVGLDTVLKQRISKGSIGFAANITESASATSLPFFTPNHKASSNILDMVEPTDLVKYGFIPEFISRLPTITTLAPLTPSDLLRILTEVRGSLVSQYTSLFGYSGVEVRFTTLALREICRQAAERGGGARGLRGIMESLLLDAILFTLYPLSEDRHVLINESVARKERGAFYWTRGEGAAFWTAWAEEEGAMDRQSP